MSSMQLYVFMAMVYAGIISGFLFMLYNALSFKFSKKRWIIAIFDLAFWIVLAICVFMVIYYLEWGEVRLYHIAGLVSGFLIFHFGIGRILKSASIKLSNFLSARYRKFNKQLSILKSAIIRKLSKNRDNISKKA